MNEAMSSTHHREYRRVAKYLVVGAGGTLLDWMILTVLKLVGWATLPANTVGFSAGVIHNFVLNRCWTFADARRKPIATQFVQFVLVSSVGLLINNVALWGLEAPLIVLIDQPAWGYLPAKAIATVGSVAWNIVTNRYWTFNDVEE